MGKVIIKFSDGHLESFKCKSSERARLVASKRRNVSEWTYYDKGERVPRVKKKVERLPNTFEELEMMIKGQELK